MSVNLDLYPYPGKWPKKVKTWRPKRSFEFCNFYDFYDDLRKLPRTMVPKTLRTVTGDKEYGFIPLTDSGNNFYQEPDRVNYYKAGDVARILKKHMNIWHAQLKSNKNASQEEFGYYWGYMKTLNQMSRLKPGTPLVISYC